MSVRPEVSCVANKRPAGELIIPPAALADERAVEMLRVWVAEGGLHCALKIGHWRRHRGVDEDQAWGKVLADAIRHIANALHDEHGTAPEETIGRLLKSLEGELEAPTTTYRGKFVKREQPE
jgi:Domain of unknown function (DUF5076)